MNAQRRKSLNEIAEKLGVLNSELEALKDEEQDYFDAMPESLQGGDKGQAAEEAISSMDSAVSQIDDAINELQTIS